MGGCTLWVVESRSNDLAAAVHLAVHDVTDYPIAHVKKLTYDHKYEQSYE